MRNPLASGVMTAPAFRHSGIPAGAVGTIGIAAFIGHIEKAFRSGAPATRGIEHHGLLLAGQGVVGTISTSVARNNIGYFIRHLSLLFTAGADIIPYSYSYRRNAWNKLLLCSLLCQLGVTGRRWTQISQ